MERHCLTDYDVKILTGFVMCLQKKQNFMQIYMKSFPELAALAASINSDTEAFDWLLKNGYPEFAALSDSIDDEDEATEWLERYHYDFLSRFAAACRQDEASIQWFKDRDLKLFIWMIETIQRILLQQSLDASNVHKIRRI
ncbi:MAG: hypothetical protein J5792_04805 [Bacteroidales bacterium]|nr:hypothetical protein [Bacteroidales bacterium]